MPVLVAGLFQVAVVAPGLQVILGIPERARGGGSVELLELRIEGASPFAALAAAGMLRINAAPTAARQIISFLRR